jgi:molybdopterin converting factor subunit 1
MSEGVVRVLFFAAARDVAGVREIELPLPEQPITVAAVAAEIARRVPALAGHLRSVRLAVNGEYALAHELVRAGDEVALIPPVAGG